MELELLQDEILRKIGRNVMLFQQVEYLLKGLLLFGNISCRVSEYEIVKENRKASIFKQTMGQVAGQWHENFFSSTKETVIKPEELKIDDAWFGFYYNIEADGDFYEERKKALELVVSERNDLIHGLILKWDKASTESCAKIEQYLDQQREKILPELEFLKDQAKHLLEIRKNLAEFFLSDEGAKFVELSFLRQSQVVAWLYEIAQLKARADGWVELSSAALSIRQQVPEAVANLKELYGHKKLKGIILATEYFDICEEPTEKGGIRVLYRIKPDLVFPDSLEPN